MALHSGKSSTRAKNKYNARSYDSLHIVVPKGQKVEILAVAEAMGDSLNSYVNKAVNTRIFQSAKIYTIIGGVNGTGKSSFTGALDTRADDLGVVIDVDKITANFNVSPIESGKIALQRIDECFEQGCNLTQETTLAGYRTAATASKAKKLGYYVRLYYIGLDTSDECIRRIANRVARGGHNITDVDVVRRFSLRWESLLKVLPHCNEAKFFDNHNGFIEVAEYRRNKLIIKSDTPPAWIQEFSAFRQKKL